MHRMIIHFSFQQSALFAHHHVGKTQSVRVVFVSAILDSKVMGTIAPVGIFIIIVV